MGGGEWLVDKAQQAIQTNFNLPQGCHIPDIGPLEAVITWIRLNVPGGDWSLVIGWAMGWMLFGTAIFKDKVIAIGIVVFGPILKGIIEKMGYEKRK
ncbi:MAG: hypothetical protein [Siphoviridae sp. ctCJE6]|nr:MAG: hypothetical protein [Siphoviridae sp. ctCJE6]